MAEDWHWHVQRRANVQNRRRRCCRRRSLMAARPPWTPQFSPSSKSTNGAGLSLAVPEDLVERIAERAAELLAERQCPAEPELLTVDEAAELLRCKRQRVYDLVSQGRLPHLKDG